ncbi:hypothetical protein BT63DRAFT_478962 [Microthyrium microscopicum]|uniref:F-box domain-containing protein n=1 Tax=Microthyrium microscopicum TaxID=703497 RepID=A0A6A6UAU9_9PEZI|nr:hypothetical protein BT63DRAFT_478962 [Microthyrium microscopicum]
MPPANHFKAELMKFGIEFDEKNNMQPISTDIQDKLLDFFVQSELAWHIEVPPVKNSIGFHPNELRAIEHTIFQSFPRQETEQPCPPFSKFEALPGELHDMIMGYLDVASLLALSHTSNAARRMIEDSETGNELQIIRKSSLSIIGAVFHTAMAASLHPGELVQALRCSKCTFPCCGVKGEHKGQYLFLPTMDRCCERNLTIQLALIRPDALNDPLCPAREKLNNEFAFNGRLLTAPPMYNTHSHQTARGVAMIVPDQSQIYTLATHYRPWLPKSWLGLRQRRELTGDVGDLHAGIVKEIGTYVYLRRMCVELPDVQFNHPTNNLMGAQMPEIGLYTCRGCAYGRETVLQLKRSDFLKHIRRCYSVWLLYVDLKQGKRLSHVVKPTQYYEPMDLLNDTYPKWMRRLLKPQGLCTLFTGILSTTNMTNIKWRYTIMFPYFNQ